CCHKQCSSQVLTDCDMKKIISRSGDHLLHPTLTERQTEVVVVAAACKRAATDSLDCRPRKIIRREIRNCDFILKPDAKNISKGMYRAKRKLLPALPKTGEEVMEQFANEMAIKTSRGELFSFPMMDSGILIFTCDTNLRLLAECETIIADGTFDYAPDKFVQMYTMHGNTMGHNVPLAYCCLPNKKGPTYAAMLAALKNLANDRLGVELKPSYIHVDFEDAPLAAFRNSFPSAEIRACKFHFAQNLIKRIRANKTLLSSYRKRESETGQWLRAFIALPNLPPHVAPDAFVELYSCVPSGSLHSFSDYVLNRYIESTRYPPSLWARAPTLDDITTTNTAESFHSRYNDDHSSSHPNIHVTLQSLLDLQEETYLTDRTIRAGIWGKAKRETVHIREKIVALYDKFDKETISVSKYLFAVGDAIAESKVRTN
ncbi:putative tRNA pseudouridine synthase D, partial [Frankliniella fusca]